MGVATAIAIGGLAVSGASTAMSFVQAGEQKKMQREAEAKAAQAMAEARKKLEINYAKERSIQKEPYELAREAMISQGAQSIQAGVESDRGAETTAGKVQMAQNEGQAAIRGTMGQELTDINKDIINENSRLRDLGLQMDLGEVEGAQLAARNAQQASAQNIEAGFQGLSSMGQQGLDMVNLYQKDKNAFRDFSGATVSGNTQLNTNQFMSSPISQQFQNTTNNPKTLTPQKQPPFGPQVPAPGSQYGPFGINWSGVGY